MMPELNTGVSMPDLKALSAGVEELIVQLVCTFTPPMLCTSLTLLLK